MDLIGVREIRMPRARREIAFGPGEQPLGGGTWLFSEPQSGLTGLVDLTALDWPPLAETATHLTIAATCTIRDLVALPARADWLAHPLISQCANSLLASWKIWHTATVGGNVATALPAGAITALLVTLDATALLWAEDGTERRILVADLVTGVRQTRLAPGEIIRSFDVPLASLRSLTGFRRIALSNLGRSGTLVTARRDPSGEHVFTITAATPRPVQLRFDELPSAAALLHAVDGIDDWYHDPHGAPDWRRAVTTMYVEELRGKLAEVRA